MIVKNLLNSINGSESEEETVKCLETLSIVFLRANLKEFKIDILQKTIEKIKYMMKKT